MTGGLSVLVPASNEAAYIGPCLRALLASEPTGGAVEGIVIANGCTDDTAAQARALAPDFAARGWRLQVLELAQGDKIAALNAGDAAARLPQRAYLDADVRIDPSLLAQLVAALSDDAAPRYASGTPRIAPARSALTRAYARVWAQVPFNRTAAPGYGLFAVNAAGRARWDAFPRIISDDTFVRLHFAPQERVQVPAGYVWPMVEGVRALVRVRRRQDQGVAEIARRFPELMRNDEKPRAALLPLLRADPVGFAVYAGVAMAVRLGRGQGWARGR